ncbi:MAG: SocA family protein [Tannerellaceae bacterium]|jgi:uncharacterized phage-associated protein|nr:SocA family protein [Tannerellaceae bacterium]
MSAIQDTYRYNSVAAAKYIAAYANEHRYAINITKIQKLLYIAYGTFLSVNNERLTDEHPQAWPYGPVFPTTRSKLLHIDIQSINIKDPDILFLESDSELKGLIEFVFRFFRWKNAADLTEWSHKDGSAWHRTTNMRNFDWGCIIPDEYIKEYFDSIIVRDND